MQRRCTMQLTIIVIIMVALAHWRWADGAAELLKLNEYCDQIGQRLIDHIESSDVSGTGMPMADFAVELTDFVAVGLNASGRIQYRSGFVAQIQSVTISNIQQRIGAEHCRITYAFDLLGVTVVYDVDYHLHRYRGHGTVEFWLPRVRAEITILRPHATQQISAGVRYMGTGAQFDMRTRVHPKNGYTQLWLKETRRNYRSRAGIPESFDKWTVGLQPILNAALKDIAFPVMRYD